MLLRHREEARIDRQHLVDMPSVRIVDPATVPSRPVRPRKIRDLSLAAVLGLSVAMSMAFILEYMDHSLGTPEEVKRRLGLPLWGSMPDEGRSKDMRRISPEGRMAYRRVLGHLDIASRDRTVKVILIASSVSGEGASMLAANLALCAGGVEEMEPNNVLLIDGDFRTPSLHQMLGVDGSKGLAEWIRDGGTLGDSLQTTGHPHLYLLPCGRAQDPVHLFRSPRMKAFLAEIREQFDLVILKGPPLVPYSDTVMLGQHTDGVLLVVKAGKTRYEVVQCSQTILKDAGVPLLGVVLSGRRYEIPEPLYRRI